MWLTVFGSHCSSSAHAIRINCGDYYIGGTRRTLKKRVKEHLCLQVRQIREINSGRTCVAGWTPYRLIAGGSEDLGCRLASNHQKRLVKEAVYIHLSAPENRDEGNEISRVWQGPLKKFTSRDGHPLGCRTAMQTTPTNVASAPPTIASQNW